MFEIFDKFNIQKVIWNKTEFVRIESTIIGRNSAPGKYLYGLKWNKSLRTNKNNKQTTNETTYALGTFYR